MKNIMMEQTQTQTQIKEKIRHIKLYRDQIKFIRDIDFKGEYHFELVVWL